MEHDIKNFIRWALQHVREVPSGAVLPLPAKSCCTDPWHYLFGSVRVKTTAGMVAQYREKYIARGWKPETYDYYTKTWKPSEYATDCQGLLDAYLTYECGELTDINANMNYKNWCVDKGRIVDVTRPYVVGEALFMQSKTTGKMTHVGWICGFTADDEPLAVEARGLAHGVVITKVSERPWTHRGLMKKKFNYEEREESTMKIKFEVVSPMHTGTAYKMMQAALNASGYTDASGLTLTEDGKWGAKSQAAFAAMIADYAQTDSTPAEPITVVDNGAATVLVHGVRITIAKDGKAVDRKLMGNAD